MTLFLVFFHSYQSIKRVVNAHPRFCRRLHKWYTVLAGYFSRLGHIHRPCLLKIALVSYQDHRHFLSVFHPLYLFPIRSYILQGKTIFSKFKRKILLYLHFFNFFICQFDWNFSHTSKLLAELTAKTSKNPSPVLIY